MVLHRKPGREGCEGQRIAGMEKSGMHTSKPRRLVNGTFGNTTERHRELLPVNCTMGYSRETGDVRLRHQVNHFSTIAKEV